MLERKLKERLSYFSPQIDIKVAGLRHIQPLMALYMQRLCVFVCACVHQGEFLYSLMQPL